MLLLITLSALCSSAVFSLQDCKPVDFGKGSIVCECNSTYCDYYPDPGTPRKGEFIWYVTSKAGKRLSRENGKISSDSADGDIVMIDSSKKYQSMEGFGGAFTDAACINIKNLSLSSQDHLFRSYFSSDGNNYNFGRVPIAGTDFSTRAYSYDNVSNDVQLKNFKLANEDYNYKIPFLKKALQLNPSLRLVAASWTAPPWMKNRPTYNGFTYLQKQYYQTYAEYIVKFLEEYKKNGLEIWATSTGNEPFTSLLPMSHINSMYWSPENVAKWVLENLGPTLQKSNSNSTHILMLDDQRAYVPFYMVYIKWKNRAALNYVKGIAVHWYMDDIIPAGLLDIAHDLFPDKFLLITEACIGDRPWDYPKVIFGSWDRAVRLVKKIIENINHWVVGWIDWNLALNSIGGPNWVENFVDAPVIVISEKDLFYKQPMFYVMAHFSKFVPRFSVRIGSKSSNGNILSTAFNTKAYERVVLLYNESSEKKNVSIIDNQVGSINIELPEYSINTVLYSTA